MDNPIYTEPHTATHATDLNIFVVIIQNSDLKFQVSLLYMSSGRLPARSISHKKTSQSPTAFAQTQPTSVCFFQ